MIVLDSSGMPEAVAFIKRRLAKVDTSQLDSVVIKRTLTDKIWNGYCERVSPKLYKIYCNTDPGLLFPTHGRRCDECYARFPCRTKRHSVCYELLSNEEVLMWLFGHEVWHYLCFTGQEEPGPDEEESANASGRQWVTRWRRRRWVG